MRLLPFRSDTETRFRGSRVAGLAITLSPAFGQTPAATTTTLTVKAGGSAATSIEAGGVVTLTATVNAGAVSVNLGQVNFCDASVNYCTDIHLLGTAQLTSSGTATLSLAPTIGAHSYKAVFAGTPKATAAYAASASQPRPLAVTGTILPSITTIAQSGVTGNYSLTATVGGNAAAPPTGTISFLNASDNNAVLGTALLDSGKTGLNFLAAGNQTVSLLGLDQDPADALNPVVTVADFNGDGFLDIAVASSGGCRDKCVLERRSDSLPRRRQR